MRAAIRVASVLACVIPARAEEPGQIPEVPIFIEASDYDACGTTGVVAGLNPQGDGFLAVRSGPGSDFAQLDRLYNGEAIYLCQQQGDWLGIVYSKEGNEPCNVTTPWPASDSYTGPCRSGWAH